MSDTLSRTPLPRRRLLSVGGAVGALAASAAAVPLVRSAEPASTAPAQPADEGATGYRLSAHVQRYYQTAKV